MLVGCLNFPALGGHVGVATCMKLKHRFEIWGDDYRRKNLRESRNTKLVTDATIALQYLKKTQNAPRPSEHPPVMGKKIFFFSPD